MFRTHRGWRRSRRRRRFLMRPPPSKANLCLTRVASLHPRSIRTRHRLPTHSRCRASAICARSRCLPRPHRCSRRSRCRRGGSLNRRYPRPPTHRADVPRQTSSFFDDDATPARWAPRPAPDAWRPVAAAHLAPLVPPAPSPAAVADVDALVPAQANAEEAELLIRRRYGRACGVGLPIPPTCWRSTRKSTSPSCSKS